MTKLNNKILLFAKRGSRGGMFFSKGKYRLHLCGDLRLDGYIIDVVAKSLGKDSFMKDFFEILDESTKNKLPLFSLYVKDPMDDSGVSPERARRIRMEKRKRIL